MINNLDALKDGKQTPMKNHPVFIAQHATATCCRGCLEKWHHIPKEKVFIVDKIGRALNLTDDDMIEMNNGSNTKYIFSTDSMLDEFRSKYPLPSIIDEDVVNGSLNIDVFGNITPTYHSFMGEDENSLSSIKKAKSLKLAINNINEK